MRRSLLVTLLLAAPPIAAQSSLYACMTSTKEYVVGAKLPPSGLFSLTRDGEWKHQGYNHPFLFGLDFDRLDPSIIYLAAGNGLIRASRHGEKWKILTGSDVTELRDVAVDPNAPGTIYFAHSHGIRVSQDGGATWKEIGSSLHRRFTEALRVDRRKSGVLVAGGEEGIFRSEDGGNSWRIAGAAGYQISHLEQSPHDACLWLATTQGGGIFASNDCALTFESIGRTGFGHTLYDAAFDPLDGKRMAVAGWSTGIAFSDDGGKTWQLRNTGLPRTDAISVVFDPAAKGRMYSSIADEALYRTDDYGQSWKRAGLDGSVVARMKFIPEGPAK